MRINRWPLTFFLLAACFSSAVAGKKPAWVTGPDPRYPEARYLIGVGIGGDLEMARSSARAEIARTVQARVQQTITDHQSEFSPTAGIAQGTQKSQIDTRLTTDMFLEGVTIVETYFHRKSRKTYALAVLDKGALRRRLTSQILDQEQALSLQKKRAESAPHPLERIRALSAALKMAQERDNLSARRRVVDPTDRLDPGALSTTDLTQALEKTLAGLPVSVETEGATGSRLRDTVVARINQLGVPLSADNTTGLVLKARLEVTPLDRGDPTWFYFRWSGMVEVTDLTSGKVVASASPDGMEGHLTEKTAREKALSSGENALGQEAAQLLSQSLFGP